MRISARADYALRVGIALATAGKSPPRSDAMAQAQGISLTYLATILGDMRRAGLVRSSHGARGGYRLTAPADQISVADVLRAMDGPLVSVHGVDPEDLRYPESAEALATLWFTVDASLRAMLEEVSLHDVATGRLPEWATQSATDVNDVPSVASTLQVY